MPLSEFVLPSFGVLISTSITLEFRRTPNRDGPVPTSAPLNGNLTRPTAQTEDVAAVPLNGGASKKELKLWRHLKKIFLKVKDIGGRLFAG
ncbi:hypothetical protein K443DRAFT_9462 [Laccaria amethystina LaAM-08-1]|uniref:Uncharacterized protein n=1 Tax=Laccaria amethystina LaAM-08-1 TaxID=1095629 RepID=A0A0C9WMC0_9AGAR|nr:hypothetical protein K443DRAFT_9462 [Laccaria amethystina LaAM-08-1]